MGKTISKLLNLAPHYGLKAEILNEDTIKVYSEKYVFDTWLITVEEKKVILYHKNKRSNRDKCYYHVQSTMKKKNWKWAMEKIDSHNKYIINKKHHRNINLVDIVLDKYNKGRKKI